jgi:uncharacterized protein
MSADGDTAVLVFARAPTPGAAKTRLIPALGAIGAALLQERMTERVLATARASHLGPLYLWCTPSTAHSFFHACRDRYAASLLPQIGNDRGERLLAAHDHAFASHRRMLVIGTDCPVLQAEDLGRAVRDLEDSDAVLVPAEDGGYVLLGLRQRFPHAFADISWGGAGVAAETLERFRAAGVHCRVHRPLWDVDRPEDLVRLASQLPSLLEGLPGTGD